MEHVAILFRQAGQQPLHALAKHSFGSGIRSFGKLGLQAFKRTFKNIAPPIQVDDGAAQYAVEPCDDIFVGSGLAVGAEGFQKAFLHDILGQMRVTDALAGEGHEGLQVL